MAVIQCPNKHFYDDQKYSECPHCKKARENGQDPKSFAENKTVAKYVHRHDGDDEDGNKTISLRESIKSNIQSDDVQKTVALYLADKNMNPVAGWIVCTKGENKGRSFEIHMGKNFIGRSMKSDIHTNDERISRENHFSIIYDPISSKFYILQGNGMTYYNGKLLSDAEDLKDGDEIEAGSSKYIFIPYCKGDRNWNE